MPITEFRNDYRFLSNFYPSEVELDGLTYPSVEHAFQAAKTTKDTTIMVVDEEGESRSVNARRHIGSAGTPGEAKKLGRCVLLRSDWEETKVDVMTNLVTQKFSRHLKLKEKLLATGDEELIEGNWWGDTFWGVCKSKGENHLGKILMQVRSLLRS